MIETSEKPVRIDVWVAMADHFLDTETRHDIPLAALRCVEAGLSAVEARSVWQHEVEPAVGFNVWDVAGEWACWDKDWLVARIDKLRSRRDRRPRWVRRLVDGMRWDPLKGVCESIERCVDALSAQATAADRERLFRALSFLARHYFDFCPKDFAALGALDRARIRSLYPEPFRYMMAPALVSGEAAAADQRVRAAIVKEEP